MSTLSSLNHSSKNYNEAVHTNQEPAIPKVVSVPSLVAHASSGSQSLDNDDFLAFDDYNYLPSSSQDSGSVMTGDEEKVASDSNDELFGEIFAGVQLDPNGLADFEDDGGAWNTNRNNTAPDDDAWVDFAASSVFCRETLASASNECSQLTKHDNDDEKMIESECSDDSCRKTQLEQKVTSVAAIHSSSDGESGIDAAESRMDKPTTRVVHKMPAAVRRFLGHRLQERYVASIKAEREGNKARYLTLQGCG